MEEGSGPTNVARAIAVALDWNTSPDARNAAVSFLETFKNGDIHALINTSLNLVKSDWPSEIRLHAFKMLQHLVRLRWEELNFLERRNFAGVSVNLMSEIAKPHEEWALKSQTAALVAEMVRREGLNLWEELLPSLISLSNNSPTQAELVAMMLRWLPEDITVHNEDLEGEQRRMLLRGLAQSLPEILPLLYTLLGRHFEAALAEARRQQQDIVKQHACAVTAVLNAINAYAEWAPLPDLARHGIIYGCGCLLSSIDFRLHACEFFKLVSPRKRPFDASASEFDSAMNNLFQVLMNVSKEFLHKSSANAATIDDSEFEFAECICESMVSMGNTNLHGISENSTMLPLYLQQMLAYFQHFKLTLHFQSLLFWQALMRDLVSKPKPAHASGDSSLNTSDSIQADTEKKKISSFISDDMFSIMLDISFQRMVRREKLLPGTALSLGKLELWSDDFEGKGDFAQYRSRLAELVRHISSFKPLIAASRVSDIILTVIKRLLLSQLPAQDLLIMESMQMALETVVIAIYDGTNEFGLDGVTSEVQLALHRVFEGLLEQLLSLKWTEPPFVKVLGHYFEALGPFLKYSPNAAGSVINKLFELLTSIPTLVVQDPSTNINRHARLQICASFVRIAKAADRSFLPHLKGIANTMAYLQEQGSLLRAEHNVLGEACLVMASAAGVQQQQEVLAWLLEPLSRQWTQVEWQNAYLSEPAGLVRLCTEREFMWSVFHTVTFFEKALKRSGIKKGLLNLQNGLTSNSTIHPMASHLSWMLPPLLSLLRVIHSLWSPQVTQTLPSEIKSAKSFSDVEQGYLLGDGNPKMQKGAPNFTDNPQIDANKDGYTGLNDTDIRNWLKGVRDSGYNVVGLSATIGDYLFKCVNIQSVALALVENIQSMEFRHMRQLIHVVLIPLVKFCPSDQWEEWLEKLLHPLFLHSEQALNSSWSSLLNEGRAKVPDDFGIVNGSDLKLEVIEEKLLRNFTREICLLLSVIASPGLNMGLSSIEHSGHVSRVDVSSLKELDAYSTNSMVSFLLKHKGMVFPALKISLATFTWTDGEAVTKVSSFCNALVLLAVSSKSVELREFVAKDMFYAIIQGLGLESNAIVSADLVGLCRDIFMHLSHRDPAPRQILLSLPCIKHSDLHVFEEALTKTSSPKEQKLHMKNLLLLATGNKLKALAAQKSVNVITNVSTRPRNSAAAPESKTDEGGLLGLAAIM